MSYTIKNLVTEYAEFTKQTDKNVQTIVVNNLANALIDEFINLDMQLGNEKHISAGQMASALRHHSMDLRLTIAGQLTKLVGESVFDKAVKKIDYIFYGPGHLFNPETKPKKFEMDLAGLLLTDVYQDIHKNGKATSALFEHVDLFLTGFAEDLSGAGELFLTQYVLEQLSRRMIRNLIRDGWGDISYDGELRRELSTAMVKVRQYTSLLDVTFPAGVLALAVYPLLRDPYRTAMWLFRENLSNNKTTFSICGGTVSKEASLAFSAEFLETLWFERARQHVSPGEWFIENVPNTKYYYPAASRYTIMDLNSFRFNLIQYIDKMSVEHVINKSYLWATNLSPIEALKSFEDVINEAGRVKETGLMFDELGVNPVVAKEVARYFKKPPTNAQLSEYRVDLLSTVTGERARNLATLVQRTPKLAIAYFEGVKILDKEAEAEKVWNESDNFLNKKHWMKQTLGFTSESFQNDFLDDVLKKEASTFLAEEETKRTFLTKAVLERYQSINGYRATVYGYDILKGIESNNDNFIFCVTEQITKNVGKYGYELDRDVNVLVAAMVPVVIAKMEQTQRTFPYIEFNLVTLMRNSVHSFLLGLERKKGYCFFDADKTLYESFHTPILKHELLQKMVRDFVIVEKAQ